MNARFAHQHAAPSRRGASILEVLVGVGVTIVVVAAAVPSLATVGCTSFRAQSRANLATLSQAHVAYAATWGDRQFTLVPDDLGAFGGCAGYVAQGNCLPSVELGTNCEGTPVQYALGCGAGACNNISAAKPITFSGVGAGFGSYLLPNAAGFNAYVDGRFYSPTFYAPDDYAIADEVAPFLSSPCGYSAPFPTIIHSSYCNSPAAMWGLGVLKRQTGYKNPDTLAEGYKSPAVSQCTYPSLKTRMMEFRAVDVDCYPDPGECPNYQFNQMYESRSLGLLFDGSVRIITPREAMESDQRAKVAAPTGMIEKGLWVRGTPFGSSGVGGVTGYDFLVDTSFHFLTGDGIAGRDVLDW
jgi:hypothetical protein